MTRKELAQVLIVVVSWRLFLFGIAFIAPSLLEYRPSFPYADILLATSGLPAWVYSWANFDGVHYLTIAENGYIGTGLIQAFFPLYPVMIWIANQVVSNIVLASILVSDIFAVCLAVTWFSLVKHMYGQRIAWVSLAILILFPTSFFWVAGYSESLFLTLVLLSFYWSAKGAWTRSILVASLATATRVVGIFVVLGLLAELWQQTTFSQGPTIQRIKEFWKKKYLTIIAVIFGSSGLLVYMAYLFVHFRDPLYFLHVQSEFGAGRSENLILFPQVVWRYIKILLSARPIDFKYFSYVQDFILTLSVPLLLYYGYTKKVPLSWQIFALGVFLVPPLTGTFSSMPRYILVCFPIYLSLALMFEKRRHLLIGYFLISGILLVINTVLFIQGYWVA